MCSGPASGRVSTRPGRSHLYRRGLLTTCVLPLLTHTALGNSKGEIFMPLPRGQTNANLPTTRDLKRNSNVDRAYSGHREDYRLAARPRRTVAAGERRVSENPGHLDAVRDCAPSRPQVRRALVHPLPLPLLLADWAACAAAGYRVAWPIRHDLVPLFGYALIPIRSRASMLNVPSLQPHLP